jgi:5-methylcytosine-specific restriction enzyme A
MPKRRSNPFVGDPRDWYQLESWRRRRRLQLRTEPTCAICAKKGLVVPATIADHVEPHRGDPIAFATGLLQSLCERCHNSDKRLLERGFRRPTIGVDGWPIEDEDTPNAMTSVKSPK